MESSFPGELVTGGDCQSFTKCSTRQVLLARRGGTQLTCWVCHVSCHMGGHPAVIQNGSTRMIWDTIFETFSNKGSTTIELLGCPDFFNGYRYVEKVTTHIFFEKGSVSPDSSQPRARPIPALRFSRCCWDVTRKRCRGEF